MANIRLPLSGNVPVDINPFQWIFGPNADVSLFSVNLGRSSDPDQEQAILDVASYGRQLGRISEALLAVLAVLDRTHAEYTDDQRNAIEDFRALMREIAAAGARRKVSSPCPTTTNGSRRLTSG